MNLYYCSGDNIQTGYVESELIAAKSFVDARVLFSYKYPHCRSICVVLKQEVL